jgi:putative chitinase
MLNLIEICGPTVKPYVAELLKTMERYQINTPIRQAAFLAQVAHESDNFRAVLEYASGIAYEARKDLGNVQVGDGVKYKGRGLIMVTGRDNYTKISQDLCVNFIDNPQLLESPKYASLAAGWFWNRNKLNTIADTIKIPFKKSDKGFILLTRKINGGLNGFGDRVKFLEKYLPKIIINEKITASAPTDLP